MGEKPVYLSDCYTNALKMAQENKLQTIAFPCISTGIYGYPQMPAAEMAVWTVKNFLKLKKDNVIIYFLVWLWYGPDCM